MSYAPFFFPLPLLARHHYVPAYRWKYRGVDYGKEESVSVLWH